VCRECRSFPTLGFAVSDLIEQTAVIPDGLHAGEPFVLTDEMLRCVLWHYRLDPVTGRFVFDRGTQFTRSQKYGKGPLSAAFVVAEAHPEGPVLFDGWDADGQPVGRPWPTPHIQITAVSEDQTANIFRALLPMIENGALAADIPDTGLTRINLPSGGLIEPVTAAAKSRLGQRVTFCPQDQTESWLKSNGGHDLAYNQRRGLAGMGGRWLSTPNAWDPTEDSVAQRTAESKAPGVYHDDVDPGRGSVRNKQERRRMLRKVYGDSASKPRPDAPWEPWVDLDRIDSEIVALLEEGEAAQAERWFLNRKEADESAAFDHARYLELADPDGLPADNSRIVIGVDGARFVDSLAIVATDIITAYQWPLGIWSRPPFAPPEYEHPFHEIDGVMLEAFDLYRPWRVYIDPQWIDNLVDEWQGRWGEKRVHEWWTNRNRQIAWAVRKFTTALNAGDFTHSGDPELSQHIRNARRRKVPVIDERLKQMHTITKDRKDSPNKMDGAMASVLSWEALGDARALGLHNRPTGPMVRVGRPR
jgi:hypothetical protein